MSVQLDITSLHVNVLDKVVAPNRISNTFETFFCYFFIFTDYHFAKVEVSFEQLCKVHACFIANVIVAEVEELYLLLDDVTHHAFDK